MKSDDWKQIFKNWQLQKNAMRLIYLRELFLLQNKHISMKRDILTCKPLNYSIWKKKEKNIDGTYCKNRNTG